MYIIIIRVSTEKYKGIAPDIDNKVLLAVSDRRLKKNRQSHKGELPVP
jgi:hypothetical protein